MPDTGRYAFQSARDAHTQFTKLFDFIAPTAIALWNLRWQVQGYLQVVPDATHDDLSARFALGSGMKGGELKRACVETSWSAQLSQFASFVLLTSTAIFEDYTADLAEAAGGTASRKDNISKRLQFPQTAGGLGYNGALTELKKSLSTALKGVFSASLNNNRRYSGKHLNNLLICYRYFKEARNCLAHHGGKGTDKAVQAYAAFANIASPTQLGVKAVPKHHAIAKGQEVQLELHGVIGLCGIILRIITTYDAELGETTLVETEIKQRVKPMQRGTMLPADPGKRASQITRLIEGGGFPKPSLTPAFEKLLKSEGIVGPF